MVVTAAGVPSVDAQNHAEEEPALELEVVQIQLLNTVDEAVAD